MPMEKCRFWVLTCKVLIHNGVSHNKLLLSLFRMGLFEAAHGWGGTKNAPLPKICHSSCKDETWHSYTLPKEDPKNI